MAVVIVRRGYSLVEFACAMAIASIVATAAIGSFVIVNRSVVQLRTVSAVDTKLKRVLARFVADLQEVGGGAVRPWHSLFVQPSEKPGGPDSLFELSSDPLESPCPIVDLTMKGGSGTVDSADVPGPFGPVCCFMRGAIDDPMAGLLSQWQSRFVVATLGDDAGVYGVGKIDAGKCRAELFEILPIETTPGFAGFATGTLTPADAKWVTLDTNEHILKAFLLKQTPILTADPEHDPKDDDDFAKHAPRGFTQKPDAFIADKRELSYGVYDFQAAAGFDQDLNGVVDEVAGGANDEWLGNAAAEADGDWIGDQLVEGPAGKFGRMRFRMLEVGVTIGLPSKLEQNRPGVQLLDGTAFDDDSLILRGGTGRATLRNSGEFQ